MNFLNLNNIIFESQKTLNGCKNIRSLKFDFIIYDNNNNIICVIETDGPQHDEEEYKKHRFENIMEPFEVIKQRDKLKNEFCKENDIPIIRIPYNKFNILEEFIKNELSEFIQFNDYPLEVEIPQQE